LIIHISVGELQRQIRFWPAEKFEFLSTIENDMVAGMADQLELFSIAIGKRWMADLVLQQIIVLLLLRKKKRTLKK